MRQPVTVLIRAVASFAAVTLATVAPLAGCGGTSSKGALTLDGGDGGQGGFGDGGARDGRASSSDATRRDGGQADACLTLTCGQIACPVGGAGGGPASLSGTVYDPAGKVPLYNVIVYIPTTPVKPITTGATCDQCGGEVTGNPLVSTLTDATGHFVLPNVPMGTPIPLVLQVGKWRRQITIPAVTTCGDTPLTDKNLLRLPKNHTEGDIPRIALSTGGADPLECLLRKIGIEDAEFMTAGGTGRVHLYAGSGVPTEMPAPLVAANKFASTLNGGMSFADSQTLWSSLTNLSAYDVLLLACEGEQNPNTKPPAALQAMASFESQGGRVFASHWHDYWFANGPAPLPSAGAWTDVTPPPPDPSDGTIDTSFPKGKALHDWLANVSGLDSTGSLPIKEPKHNVNSVGPGAQQWITLQNPNTTPAGQTAVEYMTFNMPLDVDAGTQCGRVVYSDLHVASGDQTGQPFPSGCITTDLSPQEKALEFMLFDLSSCIQSDTQPPQPPK